VEGWRTNACLRLVCPEPASFACVRSFQRDKFASRCRICCETARRAPREGWATPANSARPSGDIAVRCEDHGHGPRTISGTSVRTVLLRPFRGEAGIGLSRLASRPASTRESGSTNKTGRHPFLLIFAHKRRHRRLWPQHGGKRDKRSDTTDKRSVRRRARTVFDHAKCRWIRRCASG